MPRTQHMQNAFNVGEISERLGARIDFAKYNNAVGELLNFIIFVQGGVERRQGTHFGWEVKDSSIKHRTLGFEFNTEQAYILEVGEETIRFGRNNGPILSDPTDAVITNSTFDSDIVGWTDISTGSGSISHDAVNQTLQLNGGGGPNTAKAEQSVTVGVSFENNLHVLRFRVFSGALTLGIGTASGLFDILPSTAFAKGWHSIDFTPGTSPFFIHFEATGVADVDDVFLIDDDLVEIGSPYQEDELFELQTAQNADIMWITHRNHKPMQLQRRGNEEWDLVEYVPVSDPFTSIGDFPRGVTFFEQRIIFAGTDNQKQTFFGSKSGDIFDMTVGTDDDDAFVFTLASGKVNVIIWLASTERGLILGTAGSEFTAEGGNGEAITPTNILVRNRTRHGSREVVQPVAVGGTTLFLQKSGKKLREFTFSFEADSFVAPDLLLLSEQLTKRNTIVEMAYKQELEQSVWCVRDDGVLLLLTIDRTQDVVGWGRHIIGGTFAGGDAVVESVSSITHPDEDRDQLWMIVKRTIDGSTRRYVEFIGEAEGSFYPGLLVDSGLTGDFTGFPVTSVAGLDHLEGETVKVLGDGAVYPDAVVTGGQITGLDPPVELIEVGLQYTSRLKTLRPEAAFAGTSQGLLKQRSRVSVRVLETIGIIINDKQLPFRSVEDLMGSPPALLTEDLEVVNLGWDKDALVTVTQELAQPTQLLAILGQLSVADP